MTQGAWDLFLLSRGEEQFLFKPCFPPVFFCEGIRQVVCIFLLIYFALGKCSRFHCRSCFLFFIFYDDFSTQKKMNKSILLCGLHLMLHWSTLGVGTEASHCYAMLRFLRGRPGITMCKWQTGHFVNNTKLWLCNKSPNREEECQYSMFYDSCLLMDTWRYLKQIIDPHMGWEQIYTLISWSKHRVFG